MSLESYRRRQQEEEESHRGGGGFWWVMLILLGLGLFMLFQQSQRDGGDVYETIDSAVIATDSIVPESPPAATNGARKGMGVDLEQIRDSLSARPFYFTFSEQNPVNGESNYYGRSKVLPEALVQVLGDPENISEVALIATIRNDTAWRVATRATAIQLMESVDSNLVSWVARNSEHVLRRKSQGVDTTVGVRNIFIFHAQYSEHGQLTLRIKRVEE